MQTLSVSAYVEAQYMKRFNTWERKKSPIHVHVFMTFQFIKAIFSYKVHSKDRLEAIIPTEEISAVE